MPTSNITIEGVYSVEDGRYQALRTYVLDNQKIRERFFDYRDNVGRTFDFSSISKDLDKFIGQLDITIVKEQFQVVEHEDGRLLVRGSYEIKYEENDFSRMTFPQKRYNFSRFLHLL